MIAHLCLSVRKLLCSKLQRSTWVQALFCLKPSSPKPQNWIPYFVFYIASLLWSYDNCCIICLKYFKPKNVFPPVWEKFKSKGSVFALKSTTSWQGDHEMIMHMLTFYGYCFIYGLICANQRLSRNGLWPMLSSEPEYDSDLDISLHLILNFFSRGRAINS